MIKNILRRRESDTYLPIVSRPPPPLLPVSALAAPFNTGVSLPLQLMKATVRAESYNISSFFIVIHKTPTMSTDNSQVGVALSPS